MKIAASSKVFNDAVHGFIYIEADYCKFIIDTPNFQRLKRLEQTNVRPLYPCAHHDRFIHSLGTYHLGAFAFQAIDENSKNELQKYLFPWDECRISFEIACLLHDIGHAPFSHTFEGYFNLGELNLDEYILNKKNFKISADRKEEYTKFIKDYRERETDNKAHEKTSAILVLKTYSSILENTFHINPFLIARMILGLCYDGDPNKNEKFYNCFIGLLNGKTIDVDKLDYLARDQWAAGDISKQINVERLLSSIYLKFDNEKQLVLCFHKRAINEIYTLIEAKKTISVRFHAHHVVKYDEYVLRKAVEETSYLFLNRNDGVKEKPENSLAKVISIETLLGEINYGGLSLQLVTDDDLVCILKTQLSKSSFAREWFYRSYQLRPIWKTFSDYLFYYKNLSKLERVYLYNNSQMIVDEFFKENESISKEFYICKELDADYRPIFTTDIKIFIKEEILNFGDLTEKQEYIKPIKEGEISDAVISNKCFFLLYLPKEVKPITFIEFSILKIKSNAKADAPS
jgi:HD superfamily phosphohydrolase